MKQVHVLTAALALSLGINGILIGADVTAQAAIPADHCTNITNEPVPPGAKNALEVWINNYMDSTFEAHFGPDTYSIDDIKINGISFSWPIIDGVETLRASSHVCKPGEFTVGEAP